jgi:hypothetical protein
MTTINAFRKDGYLAVQVEAAATSGSAMNEIHVGFLLDVSVSMTGDRLAAVKRTLNVLLPLFQATDRCTVVTFSSSARTVVSSLIMDEAGKEEFRSRVDAMATEGNTDLGLGITHLSFLHSDYTAVILLTDGEITAGVSTNEGIQSLLAGFRGRPIYTLGYGAEHNRALLNRVAIDSCATYTYVDSETTLPISTADLIQGLRTEVFHDATVEVAGTGWKSIELGPGDGRPFRRIGGIVPGRPYWSIFSLDPTIAGNPDELSPAIFLRSREMTLPCSSISAASAPDSSDEVTEQIMRARVVKLLTLGTAELEHPTTESFRTEIGTQIDLLITEIGDSLRPLMLRMKGQLIDMRCHLRSLPPPPPPHGGIRRSDGHGINTTGHTTLSPPQLARFASITGVLSGQRGITRYLDSDDPDQTFSSPAQRTASSQISQQYSNADPS